ncbi:MAG: heme exporter protein CcmB, partial [Chitinophagaceae bacterium]
MPDLLSPNLLVLNNKSPIRVLLEKDIRMEIRQQYTFYGILLYIASTIFVLHLALREPDSKVWNGLFWTFQLFICVNAVAKSFLQENRGRMLYYYSICRPGDFILAKLFFNLLLMMVMSGISFLCFQLFLGNPVKEGLLFFVLSALGGSSISLVFTYLAAIAARAQQNAVLMVILGFPLLIPQLLLLMKISTIAFSPVVQNGLGLMTGILIGFDVLVVALAYILFPFLW